VGPHLGPLFETRIELEVSDAGGILDVELAFADETQAFFEAPPYAIPGVSFPEGSWELVATARDWSGNVTQTTLTLEVGENVSGSSTTGSPQAGDSSGSSGSVTVGGGTGGSDPDGGTGSPGTTSTPSDTDTVGPDASETSADGCGCTSGPGPTSWLWLPLLGLALRRRA
jgi:MYXO-CTERM domain-containing protein